MKDWDNLIADENVWLNKHYTPQDDRTIRKVVLHHNAGNLSIQGCWNAWQTREASAHYQVERGGRIGQLVHDKDVAWHAPGANWDSIGIEHANDTFNPDWTIAEATLDNGAHLVAAICRYYALGRPSLGGNVFFHKNFYPTACPGALAGAQTDAYMARAQAWYDHMTSGAPAPTGGETAAPAAVQVTATDGQVMLDVDGVDGAHTYSRFQQVMGTPVDGVKSGPSLMMAAFQRFLNAGVDPGHIQNLTGKPQLDEDGYDGWRTWKVFQFFAWVTRQDLIRLYAPGWMFTQWCDGEPGERTWKVLQHMLNESYAGSGKLLAA